MHEEDTEAAPPDPEEELPEFDYADPLKRDPETETLPGADPVTTPIPPE